MDNRMIESQPWLRGTTPEKRRIMDMVVRRPTMTFGGSQGQTELCRKILPSVEYTRW